MGEKLVIGKPANKGLRTDVTAFNIDNDSFSKLLNAYQWRGRVKRKRGTSLFGRLQRFLGTTNGAGNLTVTILPAPIGIGLITVTIGTDIFVDWGGASPITLITNSLGSAVLDRTTGTLTITGSQPNTAVLYNPTLPVMGIEDLSITSSQYPTNIFFDTDYSYTYQTIIPFPIYDVSFYKNPPASGSLPGYVPKGPPGSPQTPTSWNGQDYQQFWTTNYQGALWATNGIATGTTGFDPTNIGMQFRLVEGAAIIGPGTPPAVVRFAIAGHGLVVGDFVFINEIVGMTGINFQTGYVTNVLNTNQFDVTFPNATIAGVWVSGGIVQYITNRSDTKKDCLRWYDGDPTNGSPTAPVFVQGSGWVNFAPPLSQGDYSIADLPGDQYYLVGAKMILPFKDRLVFFGPVIQTSTGVPIYLQDTFIYSQNGTPYYTVSFTNSPNPAVDNPTSPTNVFFPILVPINQTATAPAWFEDQTGFGGFLTAGISKAVSTVSANEDVLICGFSGGLQTRMVYTGNDIVPFNLFIINSELGSESTFSVINMDQGVLTRGSRGYIITNQTSCQRIDLEIPDQVFEIKLLNNGSERVTAQRDFINEWVYFTYPSDQRAINFPNQTLQFNYRDNSWAIFDECYTTYGQFKAQQFYTWATIGLAYPTWSVWNVPWNAGSSQALQPKILAGNQQGFIIIRDDGTDEGASLTINNISLPTVTSTNHCLNTEDYIVISGVLGTIGANVNGNIYSVANVTTNTFDLNPIPTTGTYLGGGVITRMYVPDIRTKQFPIAWDMARKTRLGPQQYLLTQTPNGQVQLLMFLSQDDVISYNNTNNDSLTYSTVLYTCRESTNLGLTAANTNLQMLNSLDSMNISSNTQQQIWHRINTSLIGDTVQLGITMSDAQMRDITFSNQFEEIEIHGMILDISPSQVLA